MSITVVILLNGGLSLLAVLGLAAAVLLAHRLGRDTPFGDGQWRFGRTSLPNRPLRLPRTA